MDGQEKERAKLEQNKHLAGKLASMVYDPSDGGETEYPWWVLYSDSNALFIYRVTDINEANGKYLKLFHLNI